MSRKSASINFVKPKVDYIDEFIKWALSIGRLLVIVTELVALMTFLFRFSLDRQLIDLHSKIVQEQSIVEALKDQEDLYRKLHDKLALVKDTSTRTQTKIKIFSDFQKNAPAEVNFTNISVTPNGARINATTKSVNSLSQYVDFLKEYKGVSSVSIDRIENKASTASIEVTLTIAFEKNVL